MIALILILAFPVLAGLVFGTLRSLDHFAFEGRLAPLLDRYGMLLYAGLVTLPLAAVLLTGPPTSWGNLGLQVPVVFGLPPALSIAVAVVVGLGSGWLLYRAEWAVQEAGRPQRPATAYLSDGDRSQTLGDDLAGDGYDGSVPVAEPTPAAYLTGGAEVAVAEPATEAAIDEPPSLRTRPDVGHTQQVVREAQQLPIPVLLGTTLYTVGAEELLWRGYLMTYVQADWALAGLAALAVSAVAFGFNHLFFGWRNVVSKTALGGAWAGLFLLTGSLLVPVLSHLAFNLSALGLSIEIER